MTHSGYDEDGRPQCAAKRVRKGCEPGAAAGTSDHLGAIRLMIPANRKTGRALP